jgi:hypothetical protein
VAGWGEASEHEAGFVFAGIDRDRKVMQSAGQPAIWKPVSGGFAEVSWFDSGLILVR